MLGLGLMGLQAQTMYVQESSGTQTAYTLKNIQKVRFSSGNFIVSKSDNSTGSYALSELQLLKFSDITIHVPESAAERREHLIVYPNPASDILYINLSKTDRSAGTIRMINFEGKTVLSQHALNEGVLSLDISHLPAGIYLCCYTNSTEIITMKIIKK